MVTDIIRVSGSGSHMEDALLEADKTAAFRELSPKSSIRLRLLAEEMMGIMRSLAGEPDAVFWIEAEPDNTFRLHLRFLTRVDVEKRAQLLSMSGSGRNESAKGFTGRIRAFIDWCFCAQPVSMQDPLLMADMLENASALEWSLSKFEDTLTSLGKDDDYAREAWDELEKSVVAHLADDVKISIRGDKVEIVIIKKLSA